MRAQSTYLVSHYITKEVLFKFRGIDFRFALSQGLFSSADVDSGTRLLLKVFSRLLDEDAAAGKPLPRYVLDAGCGVGVIGICAAAALAAMGGTGLVRAQDRDELARLITAHNAGKNNIPPSALEARAEPLLAGPEDVRWDLILTNIPAKAGVPVLEDFTRRSVGLLASGGRVIMAAVQTLAGFFRAQFEAAGAELLQEEQGAEHSVLVYRKKMAADAAPLLAGPGYPARYPFYIRNSVDSCLENIPLRLETLHGAPEFDAPGGAVQAAAKLIGRIGAEKLNPGGVAPNGAPMLVHEPGQGFFPCWLLEFLRRKTAALPPVLVLSGRNILALEAARHNIETVLKTNAVQIELALIPAADLRLGAEKLLAAIGGRRYGFIAAFPELLPQSSLSAEADQFAALWESFTPLLTSDGVFIAGFKSSDAERFNRKKPAGFTSLGDIKRNGFRVLGCRKQSAAY